jgi:hypothetical protein
MQAIATNDSQNPGHSTAQGSHNKTTVIASDSTCDTEAIRFIHISIETTDSIS